MGLWEEGTGPVFPPAAPPQRRAPTWQASVPPVRMPTHIMRGVSWSVSSWLHTVWLISLISAFCRMEAPLPARTEGEGVAVKVCAGFKQLLPPLPAL